MRLGYGNEFHSAKADISGPISDPLKFRASLVTKRKVSWTTNSSAARPIRTKFPVARASSGNPTMALPPTCGLICQARYTALYFVIPRDVEANPFSTFHDANNITTPITLDNPGINTRDMYTGALKMDFNTGVGTLTSVTAYNSTEEVLTGDAYDFRPAPIRSSTLLMGHP